MPPIFTQRLERGDAGTAPHTALASALTLRRKVLCGARAFDG